jgi:hypothetical protein
MFMRNPVLRQGQTPSRMLRDFVTQSSRGAAQAGAEDQVSSYEKSVTSS